MQQWGRQNRYAGSKDRRDISDRLFAILRHYGNLAARLGSDDPLLITMLATHVLEDVDLAEIVALADGSQYAPEPISTADEKTLRHAAEKAPASQAAKLAVPQWLMDDLTAQLRDETDAVLTAMLDRAPTDVRVNLLKGEAREAQAALQEDDIGTIPHGKIDTALRLTHPAQITNSRAFQNGLVEVQDAGAQAVAQICAAQAFETVMDFCAGAGGKSLALAALMENKGRLLVHDAIESRMKPLPQRAMRAGVEIIETVPTAQLREFEEQCDLVLADVPCSGAGRWRRAPETKWRLTPDGLTELHRLQTEIMHQAAGLVRPGGRLAYITCSLLASENNRPVDAFLTENQEFTEIVTDGPDGASARHMLHPLNADSDGLFIALLKRRS